MSSSYMNSNPANSNSVNSDSTAQFPWKLVLFILFLFVPFIVTVLSPHRIVIFDTFELDKFLQLLIYLFLIALFVEQTLEIIVNILRDTDKDKLEEEKKKFKDEIDELKNKIDELKKETSITEQTIEKSGINIHEPKVQSNKLELDKKEEEFKLDKKDKQLKSYKNQTRQMTLVLGLYFGLIISALGIRVLGTITPLNDNNWDVHIFNLLDILLTGSVIAGGSEGIHKIIRESIRFFQKAIIPLQSIFGKYLTNQSS